MTVALCDLAWSEPSDYQDNQIHHLYQRAPLIDAGQWRPQAEPFRHLLEQLGPIHDAWATRLPPGGYVVPHTDASRWRERWQIPIQVAGHTILEWVAITTEHGVPFRVEQWLPHAVTNDSDIDRIHLIVDLDRYAGPTQPAPFRLC